VVAARTGIDQDVRRTAEVTITPAATPPMTHAARQMEKHIDSVQM
jgi:hypothetical protein